MVNIYGITYSISIAISLIYIYIFCKKNNLNFDFYFSTSLYTILVSLISSKIFGWFWFKIISKENISIFTFINSNGFFYGGFIGGLIFLIVYSIYKKVSFFEIADIFALPLSFSQAIGRIGCFYAGCCYGKRFNFFGLYFKKFPTQILESFFCIILFLILSIKIKNKIYNGQIFINYILFYSIFRFLIEFLRGDLRGIYIIGLSVSQIISLNIFIFSFIFLIYRKFYKLK